MPDRTLGSQLGQLALALVNATLLLGVLLVFGLWLLLGRAQDFAADTARAAAGELGERLAERAAGLDTAIAELGTLQDRLSAAVARVGSAESPAATELAALRNDVQALTATIERLAAVAVTLRDQPAGAVSEMLRQILQGLAARLGPPLQTPN
jgi:hypothetical protein